MDVQKKVTLAPGDWRLAEQAGSGFPAGVRHAILPSWKRAESIGGLDFLWFERGFADIIIL